MAKMLRCVLLTEKHLVVTFWDIFLDISATTANWKEPNLSQNG